LRQSKQLSKLAYAYAWTVVDGCRQFKFSKLLSSSFDIQTIFRRRLLLDENDLDVR